MENKSVAGKEVGMRDHITIDGSLAGSPGRHGACAWSVDWLDHDGELEPMHGYVVSI